MKIIFIGSIVFNAILVIALMFLFIRIDGPRKVMAKFSPHHGFGAQDMLAYNARRSVFQILPKKENAIVFVGNSVMADCPWSELYASDRVLNRAIGGDGIAGILGRLEEILANKPVMLVISGSRTDIVFGKSLDSIMADIDTIVIRTRTACPGIQIILLSEIPWRPDVVASRPFGNWEVHSLNAKIREYASAKQLPYVNFASLVSNASGDLDPAFSFDGVHPNGNAYAKLKTALDPYVMPVLAEQRKTVP